MPIRPFAVSCALTLAIACVHAQSPRWIAGVAPHLATSNDENECGIGAVVPWADRLWVVTYAPHAPTGSTDKLYEITADHRLVVRPESIGGTPASRMIHRESQQLFIGPYAIDAKGNVRVIPYARMFGRPTGAARHLSDPENKLYVATMEEGLYEVDVRTLEVTELWADEQKKAGRHSGLPGYHGKGLYSGQGRLVYANNGEHGAAALRDPTTPSGVLAEWDGKADAWTVVRRNQFTEVTGPGGIHGNADPERDPIWSIGWDHRSLLLQVLDGGRWHTFRLPKGSHSYDGAHGWNTEWPRIRDIGEDSLLMTMHGVFWRFPREFRAGNTKGIAARSAYLKVIGDFCRWQDRVVFGCDDTAKSEFLNARKAKGRIAAPRSQSNLWFVEPERIGALGPVRAVGGLWAHEDVAAGTVTDPLLVNSVAANGRSADFAHRGLHLAHAGDVAATIVVEADAEGTGAWAVARTVELPPHGHAWIELDFPAIWIRLRTESSLRVAVAVAHLSGADERGTQPGPQFRGLAAAGSDVATDGIVRALGSKDMRLALAAMRCDADGAMRELGGYVLDVDLVLRPDEDVERARRTREDAAIPKGVIEVDDASVVVVDDRGRRWRLPRTDDTNNAQQPFAERRVCREVATERDLFSAHGTVYELPAENAGGFAKLRPIASHGLAIHDFCSWRGLLVMTGVQAGATESERIVRSADGNAAVWLGVVDDLWQLGKVRGIGGPWKRTRVQPSEPSDPFLTTGYDHKELELQHDADKAVTFALEADLCGDGKWTVVQRFVVPPGDTVRHVFPRGWSAYWVRLRVDVACAATAQFTYR